MTDISVIILTANEELHIGRCLDKLAPLEPREVIIVDSGSIDKTLEISAAKGAVCISHAWPGTQAKQFNWALDNLEIKSEWILRLDADEYLLPELIEEIKSRVTDEADFDGVILRRRHVVGWLGDKWVKRGMYPTKMLRLFRKGMGRSNLREMDEHIELVGNCSENGRKVEFRNDFVDHSLIDKESWMAKHCAYALREARQWETGEWGNKSLYYRMPPYARSVGYWMWRMFWKGAIWEGTKAWTWCLYHALWYRGLVDRIIVRRAKEKRLENLTASWMKEIDGDRPWKEMRILMVIANFQRSAGTSVFCAESAHELIRRGHEVAIAVPNPKAEGIYPTDSSVSLLTLDEAIKQTWDVVHLHGVWLPMLVRAQKWAKRRGIKVVWSPHGMLQQRALRMKWLKKTAAMLIYQRESLKNADVIHICSNSEAQNVARLQLSRPMVKIPLGVRLAPISDVPKTYREKDARRLILFLGRVNPGKGLVYLVKAWGTLVNEKPGIAAEWRVVISGFCEEGHSDELKTLVSSLGLDGSVEVRGPAYDEAKTSLYAQASLFVLPSLSENFGSVVIEALSQGVPAIATNGTPWQDLPKMGCGWCVDVGVEPLAGVLKEATSLAPEKLRDMGQKGRNWVRETFTWGYVGQQLEALYSDLLAKRF